MRRSHSQKLVAIEKMQASAGVINALCFDIDDLAYSLKTKNGLSFSSEYLVEKETYGLLEFLNGLGLKATMFVPGYVAERFPGLIRAITEGGHDIGSHGYEHIVAEQLQLKRFRNDVVRSKKRLEDILSREVSTYRSPSWGITPRTPWAYDVLIEAGYSVDNTAQPALLKHLGRSPSDMIPFRYKESLIVIPITSFTFLNRSMPFNGGLFCAYVPIAFQMRYYASLNEKGIAFNYFCHPYEFNPGGANRQVWKCHSFAATMYGMYFGVYRYYLTRLAGRFRLGPLKEAYGCYIESKNNEGHVKDIVGVLR